jgi:propionyl-CoA carboxylase alpha chain
VAPPLTRVLVANRGEIARRIFAACRSRGIATVAVHSDPDAAAPFVTAADEAVPLGGTTAAESYLDIDAVLDAAVRTGADAVHPGYGFLAENATFATRVEEAGLVWIGPPPEAIEAMGSKVRARKLMEAAGVPIVPGRELGDDDLAAAAEEVGYPLLVKASAGGGGKGMRPVAGPAELAEAIAGARREAEAAFGDPTVFLERHLQRPRHIEIQVLADAAGTVSLGERECSVQRRHQKVLEEAPSVAVDEALREQLGAAAVAAAEAVGYAGAGTVEFLLDESGEFFFLEMNTRLQVEHPVTEMVLGIDLVAEQLRIAAGEPMSEAAREPSIDGHAIEVRLYAEDAAAGFLPQTGTVERIRIADAAPFAAPAGGARAPLRVDSGVEAGTVVGPEYDPMLAKLICWAPDRRTAAARLAAALAGAEIDGLVTNRDFLARLLRSGPFAAGETDTGLLDRELGLAEPLVGPTASPGYLAAAALAAMAERRDEARVLGFVPPGFRNNFSAPQRQLRVAARRRRDRRRRRAPRRRPRPRAHAGRGRSRARRGPPPLPGPPPRSRPPRQRPRRPARPPRAAPLPGQRGRARRGRPRGADARQGDPPRRNRGRRRRGRLRSRRPRGDEDGARAARPGRRHRRRRPRRRGRSGRRRRRARRHRPQLTPAG